MTTSNNAAAQALIDALNANQPDVAAQQLGALAETLITEPPTFLQTLDLLDYHGQPALTADLIGIVWPVVANSQDRQLIKLRNDLATRATDSLIFAYLDGPISAEAFAALVETLQTYFPIDGNGLHRYLSVLAGETTRRWSLADFEVQAQQADPDSPPPAIAEHLTTLLLEFMSAAADQGVARSRANLARQEFPVYFAMRRSGQLDPRDSIQDLMRGSRPFPFPTSDSMPSHPLVTDRTTLQEYLSQLLHFAKPQPYRAAAFYTLQPVWLTFLAERGLVDEETHARISAEIDAMRADLTSYWQDHGHDPALATLAP